MANKDLSRELLIERADVFEKMLGDLLATIHRDGGHYVTAVGWDAATQDAITKVHGLHILLDHQSNLSDALFETRKELTKERTALKLCKQTTIDLQNKIKHIDSECTKIYERIKAELDALTPTPNTLDETGTPDR